MRLSKREFLSFVLMFAIGIVVTHAGWSIHNSFYSILGGGMMGCACIPFTVAAIDRLQS